QRVRSALLPGGQEFDWRVGGRNGERAFARHGATTKYMDQHLHRLSRIRGNNDSGGQSFTVYPRLTGPRQSIATGKRQLEPAVTRCACSVILESLSCACRHRVILGSNQVNDRVLGSRQAQPGSGSFVGAVLGRMYLHQLDLDSHRLGLVLASRALLGGKTVARPLDIEHRATLGQQRRELTSLDAANLFVIGCNAEY